MSFFCVGEGHKSQAQHTNSVHGVSWMELEAGMANFNLILAIEHSLQDREEGSGRMLVPFFSSFLKCFTCA